MFRITTIAALLTCIFALAGCGGRTVAIYLDGHTSINSDWREGLSWDPFAPSVELKDVRSALADAAWRRIGEFEVTMLDEMNLPLPATLDQLELNLSDSTLELRSGGEMAYAGIYLRYDPASEHVATVACAADDRLALAADLEAGIYSIGIGALDGDLPAGTCLAQVTFAAGAATVVRKPSFSQSESNVVRDLTIVDGGDETVTVSWSERNTGDYDLNSEVSASDLVRIAQHFTERVIDGDANYAVREVVDGDENTEINSADLVPIAQNLGSMIQGYNLYRTNLASATEVPDPNASARWTKIENTANPSGPSVPRDLPAGQDFRLVYTFHDECGAGDYGWFVRAVGPGNTDNTFGPVCPAETLTVDSTQPPEAALSLEFVSPASEFLTLDQEFYVAVRVDNITGLSSVNVRLEYDASLLEFLDGTGEFDTDTNLLSNYLFLAVDDVGTAESPYQLLGFNITQKQGTAAVTGSGVVGYLHFKAIAAGTNSAAIRFPQATTYLLLWGEQYGVPVATPGLGGALSVNI